MRRQWVKPILVDLESLAKDCKCGVCLFDGEKAE